MDYYLHEDDTVPFPVYDSDMGVGMDDSNNGMSRFPRSIERRRVRSVRSRSSATTPLTIGRLWITYRKRRLLGSLFALLALLALITGSTFISLVLLGPKPPLATAAAEEGESFAVFIAYFVVWPLAVLAAWVLGGAALLIVRLHKQAVYFLIVCFVVLIGIWRALSFITNIAPAGTIPLREKPSVLLISLFVGLNVVAVCGAWRFIWRDSMRGATSLKRGAERGW